MSDHDGIDAHTRVIETLALRVARTILDEMEQRALAALADGWRPLRGWRPPLDGAQIGAIAARVAVELLEAEGHREN